MLRLAMPVVLAELGWMSMGIVDTIMVAPLGPAAIGAAGIGNALHIAFAIFGMGLLLGLDTLVSQAYGAGDHRDCHRWLVHGLVLAVLSAGPIMLVCAVVLAAIPALGFHPEVDAAAAGLLRASSLWSTLPLLLYAAVRRYLQGIHAVVPVAFALVTANLVNAAANQLLIYGGLGMPGARRARRRVGDAWLSRVYMLLVLWLAVRHYDRLRDSGLARRCRAGSRALRLARLWRLGFPAALADLDRSRRLRAGHGAGRHASTRCRAPRTRSRSTSPRRPFMVPLGIASAGAVRVGNRVGAGDPQGAARAGWTALALGGVFMSASPCSSSSCRAPSSALFSPGPDVLALGASLLLVAAVFQLFDGLQAVATGVLRGLGETRTADARQPGRALAARAAARLRPLLHARDAGVLGLWIGLSTGLIVCGMILTWVWSAASPTIA